MDEHQGQLSGDTAGAPEALTAYDREEAQKTEIRLALVINGGVSLAVWMGGVTHELDLLRRASRRGDPKYGPEKDKEVFNLWREAASSQNKTVRIDVIAGTSAGGLNGLLLATAIARNTALPNLREMWQDSASLDALLKPRASNSVLNGDSLGQQVETALSEITENPIPDAETVTLFITATALTGGFQRHEDGFGQRFDVRDHRRIYRFKNQLRNRERYAPSKEDGNKWTFQPEEPLRDFASSNEANLIRVSRATASYPVAFSPVFEGTLLRHRVRPDPLYNNEARCLTDGGVLNNAPFGPVLEEITKRRVNRRPVDRILVYIVPTGGVLSVGQEDNPASEQNCSTTPLRAVIARAVKHPQEADLRSSIEELRQRLQTSIRGSRDEIFRRIIDEPDGGLQGQLLREAAASLLNEYRRNRARAVVRDILSRRSGYDVPNTLTPPPHIDIRAVLAVLNHGTNWLPPSAHEELVVPNLTEWHWGFVPAQRFLQTLGDYLHNRLRPSPDFGYQELSPVQKGQFVKAAGVISDQLRRAILVTNAFFSELEEADPLPDGSVDQRAQYAASLAEGIFAKLDIPSTMGEIVRTAALRFSDAVAPITGTRWEDQRDIASAFLAVEILTETFAPPEKLVGQLTPRFRFMRLGPDSVGPLFDTGGDFILGDRKLYGTRFDHFGAFIDPEWRRSDFTWGRLDAVHHLLPLLMPSGTPEEKRELREKEILFHEAILAAEDLPGEPEDSAVERMRKRLEALRTKQDLQLLDDSKTRSLKQTCDATLELVTSGLWRELTKVLWNCTWTIWRMKHGQGSPLKAAKSATIQLAIGIIGMCIAITIIVMVSVAERL